MIRIRMLVAAALSACAVGASAPAAAQAGPRKMIRTINYVRGWGHHHPLGFSGRLSRGASAWARNLMRRDVLAHSSRLHPGEGEIIEWHTGESPAINSTVMEWLHSDGHRHVMLGRFRRAGAGRAVGWFDGQRSTIWVVRFAG